MLPATLLWLSAVSVLAVVLLLNTSLEVLSALVVSLWLPLRSLMQLLSVAYPLLLRLLLPSLLRLLGIQRGLLLPLLLSQSLRLLVALSPT